MNKKELSKLREKIKAENPLLTDEQVEDIVAESTKDADSDESGKDAETLLKEKEALTKEKEALEAERKALAEEKAKLDAEKKALSEKEAALSAESAKDAAQNDGKAVTYVCKMRCTFNGQYYREGDLLTIAGEAPEFFEAVKEGA